MTYTFKFSHGTWVRHSKLNDLAGYVSDMSIDDAGVEWVKVMRFVDGDLKPEWIHMKDAEPFEPVVNGFK